MGFWLASLRRSNVVMAPVCTFYIVFVKDFSTTRIEFHLLVCVAIIRAGDNFEDCVKQFQLMCVKISHIFAIKEIGKHATGCTCARLHTAGGVLSVFNLIISCDKCCFVAIFPIMSKNHSMENKTDMGLRKIDMPNFDVSLNVKVKRCGSAIDVLSNFEKGMCRNGSNFQQDYEEFLKIMANNTGKPNAPPLTNGQVFHETTEMNTLERDLLNQVGVMEEDCVSSQTQCMSYSEMSEENWKKCLQMERRIDRLQRRLKLKQSKLYGLHTSEQISGVLDFCRCKIAGLHPNAEHSDLTMDVYLKRLKRCSEQSCVSLNNEKFQLYFGSGTKMSKSGRDISISAVPKFDTDVHEHIEKISGELYAQIKAIADNFDSDVTASSSGNESLDEESPLSPNMMEDRSKKLPLQKRAKWRWLRNRARIAYRLSWLQSRMSSLEYRIHHYTEIYKKLRCSKGLVVLWKDVDHHTCSTSSSSSSLSPSLVTPGSTTPTVPKTTSTPQLVLNGYQGSLTMAVAGVAMSMMKRGVDDTLLCLESDDSCSRTCPILKSRFRKRNLIRLDTLHPNIAGISTSYPKYSSVRCDCVLPVSCVLCASRGSGVDLSFQHIYSNLLPLQSKIALLEPSYHPVLSFPSDISLSTHIGALLSNEDVLKDCDKTFENRTAPPMAAKRYYSNYKSTEEIRRANSEGLEFKRKRKYMKRQLNKVQNIGFGRSQLGKQRHSKLDKSLSLHKRRRKLCVLKRYAATDHGVDESLALGLYYKKEREEVDCSQPGSPHSSHSSIVKYPIRKQITKNYLLFRRKRGQSYDIDNFIIPPNSTPVAIVSKPQYKEISIPTWKIVHEKSLDPNDIDRKSIPAYILEDLSDDNLVKLHEMLEKSERKKFKPNATRRVRKRTDSCPETSETNTPERVVSPPVITSEINDAMVLSNVSAALSSVVAANQIPLMTNNKSKITTLSKKNNIDCDNSSVTEITLAEVPPYELRKFPLLADEYKDLMSSSLNTKLEDGQSDAEFEDDMKPNETSGIVSMSPFNESTDSVSDDPDDPDWNQVEPDKRCAPETGGK